MNFSERQIEREERHKRLSNNICSTERNINQTKKN